jgi:peptide/nickel transport system substrate-binding protein
MLTFGKSRGSAEPRSIGGMLRGRALALGIVIAAMAAMLAGCGGSSQKPSSSQNSASSQSTKVPSQITIADDQVVTSLDPVVFPDYEFDQLSLLWGGFLTTYGEGKPELASTVTQTDGYRTWTVKLREGVKFSNGTPIKAQDVVASFQRVAKSKGAATNEFIGPFVTNLSSVTASGSSTAIFRFRQPFPDFAKQVSIPEFAVLPASGIAEGQAFWKHPISAGRYAVASADLVNGNFKFTLNPYYPLTQPKVKTIVVTAVPDPATRLAELKNGQIQYAENLPGDLLPQITGNLRVDPAPWFGGSLFLQPNLEKGAVMSDVKIREAINLAVDRPQISQTALGGETAGKPLYGIPWNQTNASPNAAPFSPNIAKAKELLKGTACQNGCTLKTIYYTDAVWQLPVTIQVVAQQLSKIGIKLALDGIPLTATDIYPSGWELWMDWTGDYDNSATFLSNYYVTSVWQTPYGFSDPAMVALGKKMAITDPNQLSPLIAQANQLFAQYLPIIPLTTLTYLGGSSLPANVMTNTGAAYFDLG